MKLSLLLLTAALVTSDARPRKLTARNLIERHCGQRANPFSQIACRELLIAELVEILNESRSDAGRLL